MKKMMVVVLVLQPLEWSLPFHVFVDASNIAVGVVLMQEKVKNWFRPVYYASEMLTSAERNYSVKFKERLWEWYFPCRSLGITC